MKSQTIQALRHLNRSFYARAAQPFDRSRQAPWPGWQELAQRMAWPGGPACLRVLDVGCGNGRFQAFLETAVEVHEYVGVDQCVELLDLARAQRGGERVRFLCADAWEDLPVEGDFDLVTAFGLLHHVPSHQERARLLQRLAGHVVPGGHLAVAFWRFLEEPRLAAKVRPRSEVSDDLGPEDWEAGDALLPFQGPEQGWRYCHDCDEAEQEALLGALPLELVDRFRADGKEGRLNQYALLRRAEGA